MKKYRIIVNTIGFEHRDGYIEVSHWNGDDLVEAPPSVLMTQHLLNIIKNERLTGIISTESIELKGNMSFVERKQLYKISLSVNETDDLFFYKESVCISERARKVFMNSQVNILEKADYKRPVISPWN